MRSNKEILLKEYFGYDCFRVGQEEVIDNILDGKDTLCIMPTGAGKSICYQIPSLILDGVTIVVSPLISLMKDQVEALKSCDVKAAFINSSLAPQVIEKVLLRVSASQYKIIYIAPERLNTYGFLQAVRSLKISLIVVDEAHCISRWGHDFRPSYLEIVKFINNLPVRPILSAFTATATSEVKDDICKILAMHNPFIKITTFNRTNLFFDVKYTNNKDVSLMSFLKNKIGESGIIYCSTRKKVEEVCKHLAINGISCTRYHAGLSDEEKTKNQSEFVYDKKNVMVATNAFGMGIDKSNVSFVIHYNMPKDMESYYQEAGRAGRDGSKAQCVLFFSESDVETNKYLIRQSEAEDTVIEHYYELLNKMIKYCKTEGCLRGYILDYFGENHVKNCGFCGNCIGDNFVNTDATQTAKTILLCIRHLSRKFGKNLLISVLRGSNNERIKKYGLNGLPEYGLLKDVSLRELTDIIDKMIDEGLIKQEGNDYPVLKVANDVVINEIKFIIKIRKTKSVPKMQKQNYEVDDSLFIKLKNLRYEIASLENVPAYVVFSDATLADMCVKKPQTIEEFLHVSGVGKIKCERYGEKFISTIINHTV